MMDRLFKTHLVRLIASSIVLVVAVVGIIWFGRMMHTKEVQVITAKDRLAAYDRNKQVFAEESVALATLSDRIHTLERYRVTTATTPDLLSSIESLANGEGIDFAITTAQTPGAQNAKQKLLIDFSATGTAVRMDAFLAALTHQTYQIKFTKFALVAQPVTDPKQPAGQWSLLASIQIVSF